MTERAALLEKSKILTQKFNSLSHELDGIERNMNTNLQMGMEEFNRLTKEIAGLNERILAAESSQTTANDLRDQRNRLLEQLSGWVDITYLEDSNGTVMVQTSKGIPLVNGNRNWDLSIEGNSIYRDGVASDVSDRLTGGKLGGWLDLRDEIIPQYAANLDELAGTLIQQVNSLHTAGFTLSGGHRDVLFPGFHGRSGGSGRVALAWGGYALARSARREGRAATAAAAATIAAMGVIANVSYGLWQEWWLTTLFLAASVVAALRAARG